MKACELLNASNHLTAQHFSLDCSGWYSKQLGKYNLEC